MILKFLIHSDLPLIRGVLYLHFFQFFRRIWKTQAHFGSQKKNHETSIVVRQKSELWPWKRGSWSKSLSTKRRQLINCTISSMWWWFGHFGVFFLTTFVHKESDSNQVKDFGEGIYKKFLVRIHVHVLRDVIIKRRPLLKLSFSFFFLMYFTS